MIEVQFLLDKISKLNIGWNERALGEDDAFELARRLGVEVQIKSMSTDGFYFRLLGREFIAINRNLPSALRLKVLFHELAHLLFHAPTSGPAVGFHRVGKRNRQEIEADTFAICAVLPVKAIKARTVEELIDDGFAKELVYERVDIWHRFGI